MTVGLRRQLSLPLIINEVISTRILIYSPCRLLMKFVVSVFNEYHIIEYINTLYENRYITFVGVCPKTAPSQGYTICKYVNWVGMHGRIGEVIKTTIVNIYTFD